jgi:hypothetical protein
LVQDLLGREEDLGERFRNAHAEEAMLEGKVGEHGVRVLVVVVALSAGRVRHDFRLQLLQLGAEVGDQVSPEDIALGILAAANVAEKSSSLYNKSRSVVERAKVVKKLLAVEL